MHFQASWEEFPPDVLSLKPRHLQRYKDVAALALKYRNLGLVPAAAADAPAPRSTGPDPAELAADLKRLGPASSSRRSSSGPRC